MAETAEPRLRGFTGGPAAEGAAAATTAVAAAAAMGAEQTTDGTLLLAAAVEAVRPTSNRAQRTCTVGKAGTRRMTESSSLAGSRIERPGAPQR